MTEPGLPERRQGVPLAIVIGLVFCAVTIAWWYFYYSQYGGEMDLISVSLPCFFATTDACQVIQQKLAASAIPPYHPVLWWAGLIVIAIGIAQARSRRS